MEKVAVWTLTLSLSPFFQWLRRWWLYGRNSSFPSVPASPCPIHPAIRLSLQPPSLLFTSTRWEMGTGKARDPFCFPTPLESLTTQHIQPCFRLAVQPGSSVWKEQSGFARELLSVAQNSLMLTLRSGFVSKPSGLAHVLQRSWCASTGSGGRALSPLQGSSWAEQKGSGRGPSRAGEPGWAQLPPVLLPLEAGS